ncbi:MAG: xanthine dehydrogenase family protein subunit M [Dehalococcoidales bacterium]|nr:xanthine dehydrogenase family protein subunit M [Dehalococcoidales bacterium]
MHPFVYAAPSTVKEAVEILTKHGDKARPMAGGTDLLVQIRGGRFDLDMVVDIKKIPELTSVTNNNDGLVIGSAVACHQLYEDDDISKNYPGLIDAATLIGGIQIQSRSGFGGNLCNATPSADGIGPLIVHSTVANIQGESGTRSIPVEEFCTGPGRNALGKGEMLVSLSIPNKGKGFGAAYERFIPRNEMDIAVAAVASSILVGSNGKISEARIALASVGPTPIFAKKASDFLIGKEANEASFKEAAAIAKSECSPIEDMRGTIEQRQHLVEVITLRTLNKSLERIEG